MKLLSVNIVALVFGMSNLLMSLDECKFLPLTSETSRFFRYTGASPFSDLKTRVRIFNFILCHIGSQCRLFRTSVLLEYQHLFSTNFVAIFLYPLESDFGTV